MGKGKLLLREHVPDLSSCRHYDTVPKGYYENLAFRERVCTAALKSKSVRRELRQACSEDILFWFNTFVWTFDPRLKPKFRRAPFITYEFQDYVILDLLRSLDEGTSRAIQKPRDMGMSWICLGVGEHQWQFSPGFRLGIGSRKAELVVKSNDIDAAFTRLEYIRDAQPGWLLPNRECLDGRWINRDLGGSIAAEPTTDEMFRAGRYTVAILDEFGRFSNSMAENADQSSASTTESRWFNSTPNGSSNCFHKKCNPKPGDPFAPVHIRLKWQEHPEHVKGLYTSEKGKLQILDKKYKWPKDYPFVLDGKVRSAWYDKKCAELGWVESKIAEELDGEFCGSGDPAFDYAALSVVADRTARPPLFEGELLYDEQTGDPGKLVSRPNGPFRMWINLDAWGKVPGDEEYVIGVDISKGRGVSNDAACVWGRRTAQRVAGYVDCKLGDYKLAELVVAMGRMFHGAKVIWEIDNGTSFYKRLCDLGYNELYLRDKGNPDDRLGPAEKTMKPGWSSSPTGKEAMLKSYYYALIDGGAINRDRDAILELSKFQYKPGGGLMHEDSAVANHPSAAGKNHGDVAIADGLAWLEIETEAREAQRERESETSERIRRKNALDHPNPPYGTPAYRIQERMRAIQKPADLAVF